jgi:hypothetical protein
MAFSRQFQALLKIAGFFAGTWGLVGAVVGLFIGSSATGDPVAAAAARFALMYATAGGIAGTTAAWLVARAETGRRLRDIPTWRLALWGVLGGVAPAAIFATLGLVAGAPMGSVVALLGLGVVGGGVSGLVAGSASAIARRVRAPDAAPEPRLPAS